MSSELLQLLATRGSAILTDTFQLHLPKLSDLYCSRLCVIIKKTLSFVLSLAPLPKNVWCRFWD